MKSRTILTLLYAAFLFGACTPSQQQPQTYNVLVVADGRERGWQIDEPITVQELLDEVGIQVGPLDRMVPEPWTQISDGLRITIRRVREEEYCEESELPFARRTEPVEGLNPGEQRIAQVGRNGIEEICYRVRIEDNVELEPVVTGRTVRIQPQDEVVWVAPSEELEPVSIVGTLAYINKSNAWVMRGSSRSKVPLTVTGELDERAFSLSSNGKALIFTQRDPDNGDQSNRLWLITDVTQSNIAPIPLPIQNILYSEWILGRENMIAYSTFEVQDVSPGWRALNDLWQVRIDSQTGEQISIDQLLDSSCGGPYCWWGNDYRWAPDGNRLVWIRADGLGLVDLENGELGDYLVNYTALTPSLGDWSWRATASWSPDGSLLATTVHGPPIGNEPPASSPVFNLTVAAVDGSFSAEIVERVGVWAAPQFSPELTNTNSPFPKAYLAYFKAREWQNSISGEYDLVVADRDGSNARVIFPANTSEPGIDDEDLQMTWSPDGRQIAFIYLGNLWVIDVKTGVTHQLTQDNGASSPIWTR